MVSIRLLWFRRRSTIGFDKAVVPSVAPPDQLIGSMETSKPRCVNRAGWHVVCLVDEDTRELSLALEEDPQPREQIIVRQMIMPGFNDASSL